MLTITSLFTYDADAETLPLAQEVALITAAQDGDAEAYDELLRTYGPALRNAVNRAKKTLDVEEARSTALLAFHECLMGHDVDDENYVDGRLAPRLLPALKEALGEAQVEANALFQIPRRSFTRYLGILAAADGDALAARELAPSMGMKETTFDSIRAVVHESTSVEAALAGSEGDTLAATPILEVTEHSTFDEVEDRVLIEIAFTAVDDEEARIIELGYGFTEYDPVPDAEIGHRLGLSRPAVQRKRGKGLSKMRESLGVTL